MIFDLTLEIVHHKFPIKFGIQLQQSMLSSML